MKFGKETEEIFNNFEVDMTDKEMEVITKHGRENCPQEEIDTFILNWAMVDIIKTTLENSEKNSETGEILDEGDK